MKWVFKKSNIKYMFCIDMFVSSALSLSNYASVSCNYTISIIEYQNWTLLDCFLDDFTFNFKEDAVLRRRKNYI